MQHLVAASASADQAALANLTMLADTALSPSGTTGQFVPQGYDHIHWAYAVGPSLTRSAIVTPSIGVRRMSLEIAPARRGTEIVGTDGGRIFVPAEPIQLTPGEVLNLQAAEDACGASRMTIFCSLGPPDLSDVPAGEIRAVRLTGTTTLTARVWTQVALTPDVTLEAGEYVVVGMVAAGATLVAARLVFEGGGYRPGVLCSAQTAGNPLDLEMSIIGARPINRYPMGTFRSTALPSIEAYGTAGDTAQTVYLYVIRVGDLRA